MIQHVVIAPSQWEKVLQNTDQTTVLADRQTRHRVLELGTKQLAISIYVVNAE